MAPPGKFLAVAALAAAACVGIGIGIGAAIWQGDDAPAASAAPAAALPTKGTSSWLFVVRAASGSVTATGGDDLTIVLRGVPPTALAFTDRPALQAAALSTSAVGAAFAPDAAGYADGAIAPLNAALTFAFEGAPVALPVTILDVARAGRNYTLTARAMPAEGGGAVAVQGGAAVRETSSPLWAARRAGLELEAPAMFIDNVEAPSTPPPPSLPWPPGTSPPGPDYDYGEPPPWTCTTADPACVPTNPNPYGCNSCVCDPGNPNCSVCPNDCNCNSPACGCNNMCVVTPSAPYCCCSCDAATCGSPGNTPCCEPCTGSDEYPCCCTEPGCTQQYDWAPTPPPPRPPPAPPAAEIPSPATTAAPPPPAPPAAARTPSATPAASKPAAGT